jgi:hypothetical protein
VNAREDDDVTFEYPIPKHVGESPQEGTAGSAISIRVCKRIVCDSCGGNVHCVTKLTTETRSLLVIPILDSLQVELGRSTDENRLGQ